LEKRGAEKLLVAAKQRGKGGHRLCFDKEKLETRVKEKRGQILIKVSHS